MAFFEHGEGLADAGGVAEIDLELAEAAFLDEAEKVFGFQTFDGQWCGFRHGDNLGAKASGKKGKLLTTTWNVASQGTKTTKFWKK
jgi:hypothetical protein